MAGKAQHEIPRLYQRGFLIANGSGTERVFVFRKGGKFFPSNIDRSAAEGYFYSKPSITTEETLDDTITKYERDRLALLVTQLRAVPIGGVPDSVVVAEVAAHLTTRNAHLRGVFTHGVTELVAGASRVFSEEESFRRMLGLDRPVVSAVLREALARAMTDEPRLGALGIPQILLERIAVAKIREDFPTFFNHQRPMLESVLRSLSNGAMNLVGDAHRKALHRTFVPDRRVEDLSSLSWQAIAADADLILPDCVALAIDRKRQPVPLIMASANETELVLLPLTARTLLVGTRRGSCNYDPADFNVAAASCSHYYFISASDGDDIQPLMQFIGSRSVLVVDSGVSEAFESYAPAGEGETPPKVVAEFPASTATQTIPVSFIDGFDSETAGRITEVLSDLVADAAWTVPLGRLDGFTFADDYAAALASLDRGIPGAAPPSTRQDGGLIGIAQCPNVVRDGIIKSHIVARGDVGRALLSEDDSSRSWATCVIANQLAHAGITQVVDEALPGALLSPVTEALDATLQPVTFPAWNAYFSARAVARFGDEQLRNAREVLLIAVRGAFDSIPRARLAYRKHGDIDELLKTVLPKIALILELSASLLGYATSLERDTLCDAPELEAELRNRELLAWLDDFRRDLEYLWNQRGRWDGLTDFLALNRHAERLLWPFAIFLWTTPDGRCRVAVPIGVDLQTLEAGEKSEAMR